LEQGEVAVTGIDSQQTSNGNPASHTWRRIAKRLIWEFWLSFVVAAIWASFSAWPFVGNWILGFVTSFSVAFFFVSWLMGQIVRVGRQQATEDSFQYLVDQLNGLHSTVTALTSRFEELLTREPALKPVASEISNLASTANAQLAQATNTVAALSQMRVVRWDALPAREVFNRRNPEARGLSQGWSETLVEPIMPPQGQPPGPDKWQPKSETQNPRTKR
jgi:hypothetical protein